MFLVCFLTIIGATVIFGYVINATILGLNYIGKNSNSKKIEYNIKKIVKYKTRGRKKIRRNNLKVTLEKDGKIVKRTLSEHYNLNKKYSEYNTIKFIINKGLFGFEVIENNEFKK
ncbi:hypothetical protein SAMN05216503_2754 [Polaribacter sp. KT25b]|nr:hypothetical protein SAMN05216503_2754 [Polaribacter sp. KT25b]